MPLGVYVHGGHTRVSSCFEQAQRREKSSRLRESCPTSVRTGPRYFGIRGIHEEQPPPGYLLLEIHGRSLFLSFARTHRPASYTRLACRSFLVHETSAAAARRWRCWRRSPDLRTGRNKAGARLLNPPPANYVRLFLPPPQPSISSLPNFFLSPLQRFSPTRTRAALRNFQRSCFPLFSSYLPFMPRLVPSFSPGRYRPKDIFGTCTARRRENSRLTETEPRAPLLNDSSVLPGPLCISLMNG